MAEGAHGNTVSEYCLSTGCLQDKLLAFRGKCNCSKKRHNTRIFKLIYNFPASLATTTNSWAHRDPCPWQGRLLGGIVNHRCAYLHFLLFIKWSINFPQTEEQVPQADSENMDFRADTCSSFPRSSPAHLLTSLVCCRFRK